MVRCRWRVGLPEFHNGVATCHPAAFPYIYCADSKVFIGRTKLVTHVHSKVASHRFARLGLP
jgi:hypothetical protein